MARPLPAAGELPDDFYQAYVVARRPLVLRGGARHFPAVGRWTPASLRARLGGRPMPVSGYGEREGGTLGAFLDALERPGAAALPYLRNVFLHHELPELSPDVGRLQWTQPNWLDTEPFASLVRAASPQWLDWCELFISAAGTRFPNVHVDRNCTHAWVAQVYGSKVWWVWPPRPGFTSAEPGGADLDTFFDEEPYRGVLEAGDALFLPADWPHTAESATVSISLSGNFVNDSNWLDFSRSICEGDLRRILRGG